MVLNTGKQYIPSMGCYSKQESKCSVRGPVTRVVCMQLENRVGMHKPK